jgi:LysM repeat protein
MQNVRKTIVILLLLVSSLSKGQAPAIIQNYINTYKDLAIAEMQRTGVPAAIKLAQGIHETQAGTSDLVLASNNHFGIKCKDTWTGESVTHDDDARGECFRKYPTAEDSYRDHSNFLKGSSRYANLFKLDPTDYSSWAWGLKKDGYATNPKYPQIIIKLIEDYHLQDYTLIALGKMPATDNSVVKNETLQPETNDPNNKNSIPIVAALKQPVAGGTVETDNNIHKIIEQPIYPESEFKINDTRVIYAKKGTSFLSIAEQYNLPLARIFEFNDMAEGETVNKDQLIFLQRKRKTGNNEFHIVQSGETVYDIAQAEAIRLETLLEYNLLEKTMKPAMGEKLYLRNKAMAMPKLELKENYTTFTSSQTIAFNNSTTFNAKAGTNSSDNNAISYSVLPRETIYSIAKKYNVKIDDIVKWNKLSGYDLKTGQQLVIYK